MSGGEASAVWSRWRVRLGYPVALAYAVLAKPVPRMMLVGAGVALLGLLIRAAAAGHLRKHEALATSGAYRYTRNPLYFGSALLAAGFLLAGNSWLAALPVVIYFAVLYPMVMRREEQELRARYGAAFDAYAARVPLFFPRLLPGPPGDEPFSWSQYVRNREYQAVVGTALGFLVLWMSWYWGL